MARELTDQLQDLRDEMTRRGLEVPPLFGWCKRKGGAMPASRRPGGISKRCECRDQNGRRLAGSCPQLEKRNHGKFR
ncbi:hypothetical protein GCM10010344_61950 [Streptomyces bluensis]|nr:hypothetical protein GCM10010344_61950 [Streptomyces bluensis]